MVPERTSIVMLELVSLRIVLLVRLVSLIGVNKDDFLVRWRYEHESSLIMGSFVGVDFSLMVPILISPIKVAVEMLGLRLTLVRSMPMLSRLSRKVIIKSSHPVGYFIWVYRQII